MSALAVLLVLLVLLGFIAGAAIGYGIAIVVLLREWRWES